MFQPNQKKTVIGMLHLPALPGSPLFKGRRDDIISHVIADAKTLTDGGVHALMMENFGDVPFTAGRVTADVVAMMTVIATEVRRVSKLPLGINVLRNDPLSALSIAAASGANFIRVNVLTGARVTDQGLIQGDAYSLLRARSMLGADIKIYADVDVKHSAPLASRDLHDEVEDAVKRGLADGLIVSGRGTGKSVDIQKLKLVFEAAQGTPVLVGSGVDAANLTTIKDFASGFIVGTSFKIDSDVARPVELSRVQALIRQLDS